MYLTRHQTFRGPCWAVDGHWLPDGFHLDFMLQRSLEEIRDALANARTDEPAEGALHAPIEDTQEVWAAGVTYLRSREARMAESETADIYDRVYNAERVEVFFKATGWRVMGHGDRIRVRRDSTWNVPEPELALVLNRAGEIVGYTAGNDVSSRSIEGENPLYLPQAKVYDGSCALGPGIVIADPDTMRDLPLRLTIERGGTDGVRRRDPHLAPQAFDRGDREVALRRARLPRGRVPHDRHGPRAARRVHPETRRRGPHRTWRSGARQHGGMMHHGASAFALAG